MKQIRLFSTLTILVLTLNIFAGCASSSKDPANAPYGSTMEDGSAWQDISATDLPDRRDGMFDDELQDRPLPQRQAGMNPATADFKALEAYTVYFDFDSFSINAAERHKVENIALWMQGHPDKEIVIAGHTDSRGTTEYNLALGERRALAVRDYLVGLGIDGNRVYTLSYGEEQPAVMQESETAWAQNRRAQVGVL